VTPPNDETKFRNAIEYVRLIKLGDSAEAAAMKLHMTSEDLEFAKTAHFFMPDTLAKFAHDEERRIQDVLLKREKMLDEAYQCFVKGNSLDPLNTELMYHLANALKQAYDSAPESDEECQPYLERSFALFRQAAALGHTESLFELGNQYSGRDTTLVKVDHEQATELYRMAAEKGHLMAHVILAECYAHGIGVNQDDEMAAYLSLKASNLEDENA